MSTTQINLTMEDGCEVAFMFEEPPALALNTPAAPLFEFDANPTHINLALEDGCEVAFMFEEPPALDLNAPAPPSLEFDVGTVTYSDYPAYEGSYTSIPQSTAQVYATEDKRMTGNFTVLEIPVYRADNTDGVTVTIAES